VLTESYIKYINTAELIIIIFWWFY